MKTHQIVTALQDTHQDFEWYPTTSRIIGSVMKDMSRVDVDSVLDIGAGDGRVLTSVAKLFENAKLYSIEKSPQLQQLQSDTIMPVGAEFWEQDLMSLPVSVVFCNPPYSEFEAWASRIISTAYALRVYLVLPQRWSHSEKIREALKTRAADATVIHEDDFLDAPRQARAVVQVIRVQLPSYHDRRHPEDPFDVWFDQHIDTFDVESPVVDDITSSELAKIRDLKSIGALVDAFDEEYTRMQDHYRAIFKLDAALLKELGVNKQSVREGLKARMVGLKSKYWTILFDHLSVITDRLTTTTKKMFLDRLTGRTAVAFTVLNAYTIVQWAIKSANLYFDTQLIQVFREFSTPEGVSNYVSNQRTWERDRWRYADDQFSHYALDYRVVLHHQSAIFHSDFGRYDYPGDLHRTAHERIDDLLAVFGNLGFLVRDVSSRTRVWTANRWEDFCGVDGEMVFQVKGFLNGNLHFRFRPAAIKALNIEAGRLLGWLRGPADVVTELGYTREDADQFFGSHKGLLMSHIKFLTAGTNVDRVEN